MKKLLTITEIITRIPGRRGRMAPSTITRWILAGCPARNGERVRLKAIRAGGRWLIREADLAEFFQRLGDDPATPPPPPSPSKQQRAAAAAGRRLEAAGW